MAHFIDYRSQSSLKRLDFGAAMAADPQQSTIRAPLNSKRMLHLSYHFCPAVPAYLHRAYCWSAM